MDIHTSVTLNSHKEATTQMPMDKQNVVYSLIDYKAIKNKRNTDTYYNMDDP